VIKESANPSIKNTMSRKQMMR